MRRGGAVVCDLSLVHVPEMLEHGGVVPLPSGRLARLLVISAPLLLSFFRSFFRSSALLLAEAGSVWSGRWRRLLRLHHRLELAFDQPQLLVLLFCCQLRRGELRAVVLDGGTVVAVLDVAPGPLLLIVELTRGAGPSVQMTKERIHVDLVAQLIVQVQDELFLELVARVRGASAPSDDLAERLFNAAHDERRLHVCVRTFGRACAKLGGVDLQLAEVRLVQVFSVERQHGQREGSCRRLRVHGLARWVCFIVDRGFQELPRHARNPPLFPDERLDENAGRLDVRQRGLCPCVPGWLGVVDVAARLLPVLFGCDEQGELFVVARPQEVLDRFAHTRVEHALCHLPAVLVLEVHAMVLVDELVDGLRAGQRKGHGDDVGVARGRSCGTCGAPAVMTVHADTAR